MNAPIVEPTPGHTYINTMFDETLVNPLGYIYAGRWTQALGMAPGAQTGYQRSGNIVGWDASVGGWADNANSNLYSCENWDIMRQGLQQNSAPETQIVKNHFDKWIGNWEFPEEIGTLVAAAQIPANITAMRNIPGWQTDRSISVGWQEWNKPLNFMTPSTELNFMQELLPQGPLACYDWWWNLMNSANPKFQQEPLTNMQDDVSYILSIPDCALCDVESRGRIWIMWYIWTSKFSGFTEWQAAMSTLGWTSQALAAANYVPLTLQNSVVASVSGFFKTFVAAGGTDNPPSAPTGFATLPASITNSWCTDLIPGTNEDLSYMVNEYGVLKKLQYYAATPLQPIAVFDDLWHNIQTGEDGFSQLNRDEVADEIKGAFDSENCLLGDVRTRGVLQSIRLGVRWEGVGGADACQQWLNSLVQKDGWTQEAAEAAGYVVWQISLGGIQVGVPDLVAWAQAFWALGCGGMATSTEGFRTLSTAVQQSWCTAS